MNLLNKVALISLTIISLMSNIRVKAETEKIIEMGYDTPSFTGKILEEQNIKISVNYQSFQEQNNVIDNNIIYRIFYDNQQQIEEGANGVFSSIYFKYLDQDKTPELIIQTYSGGAHCCTNYIIYTWINDQFVKDETGLLDGGGGLFEDLNGDGNSEFITGDNRFLYTFAPYAGSLSPSLIFYFKEGKLIENTRNYPDYLRKVAEEMLNNIEEVKKEYTEINGLLAGYVAQKILLNEYDSAWEYMLANYDPNSDWGLTIYNDNGDEIGKYPDFPTALKAFLVQYGYL
jgi:hypothetical protein